MMFVEETWLDILLRSSVLTVAALLWVVLLVRVVGLRSFSKMTAFDFVMTVATGSLLAGAAQATQWSGFAQAMLAMAALFVAQYLIAQARQHFRPFQTAIENEPVLLMRDGEFYEAALEHTRVAKSDVMAKLREANVLDMAQVRAVVLETTGDISVLHGDGLEPVVLKNVRDVSGDPPETQNP